MKAANALAHRDGLSQVASLDVDMNDVTPALFPKTSFDLVHLSFLGRYILTADYPDSHRRALPCVVGVWCAGQRPNCRLRRARSSNGLLCSSAKPCNGLGKASFLKACGNGPSWLRQTLGRLGWIALCISAVTWASRPCWVASCARHAVMRNERSLCTAFGGSTSV